MAKPLSCFLVTIHSPDVGKTRVVNENTFTIGRASECAISFTDLNVSRGHLIVKNKGGKVYIEDQNSANGTFVNGVRIEGKRLVQIQPDDKIKLGSAGPLLSIHTVERVFNEQAVDESSLKKEDREAVLGLVNGAHAEAARLVAAGKEAHDKFLKMSEEKAVQLEKQAHAQREMILEEARKAAQVIIDKAKAHHNQTMASAIDEAMMAAKSTVEKAIQDAREEAAQLLIEAQNTAVRTMEEAKFAAKEVIDDAKAEAEKYAREHREGSEREADAYFSKRHQEIEQFSIKKAAEVDDYRAEQERVSRETMAKEIEKYIQEKRELENSTEVAKKEFEKIGPQLKTVRSEYETLHSKNAEMREENEKLKTENASLVALESKREDLAKQVAKLEIQLAEAERQLPARLAEDQGVFEKESSRRRTALEEQLNQMRLAEMERLRRERAEAVESIARERERLGKKILVEIQQAAVANMPVDQWRAAAGAVETAIQENLKLHSLSAGAEESLSPLIAQVATNRKRQRLVYSLQGFFTGMLVLVAGWQAVHQVFNDEDPVKAQAEENARRIQEDLERRKFNPPKDGELRANYVDSVIYTQGFAEKYRDAEFQKHWMKKASTYFLKKWKVQEESVIQVLSATATLVAMLAERKEAIHPDHVQEGLKRMNELEAETLAQVKELLGSEVRVEAYKRLEKKTYLEFFSTRMPAQDEPASK